MEKQLAKESLYRKVADMLPYEKVVIIHDRGVIDNKSYMRSKEFGTLLNHFNMSEVEARDRYNAVFHLVTAANGAEEYYTLANNAAKTETPEEARHLDALGIANWTGHPHLHIIDNSTDFNGKICRLMDNVYSALGISNLIEIDRKYLIKKPNLAEFSSINFTEMDIIQSYLKSPNHIERRLRQRGQDGSFSYYLTEKLDMGNSSKRPEVERKISDKDYLCYLSQMDPTLTPIVKKRICFVCNNQYFRVDLFDFSNEYALMEIDCKKDSIVIFPDIIQVVKDVTGDPYYRNCSLSRTRVL